MKCNFRYCNKEINYGRPDRKFCNKNCKSKENKILSEIKILNRKVKKTKEFIEKASKIHENKFIYELVVYTNCRSKVKIICPIHGIFEQTPNHHIYQKHGCDSCAKDAQKITKLSPERINKLKKIHNNKYSYPDPSITKGFINIECPEHGTFKKYLYFHEYGQGCTECNSSLRGEDRIKSILETMNLSYYRNHIFDGCKNKKSLRFDFYLPNLNLCIEYNGEHHFKENKYFGISNLEYFRKNDDIKNKYCKENNIQLIRIPYYDYSKINEILSILKTQQGNHDISIYTKKQY